MDAVDDFKSLIAKLNCGTDASMRVVRDHKSRALICTPYVGGYDTIYGWVICVNGSPPKGTILIKSMDHTPIIAFYIYAEKSKAITGTKQIEVIKRFCDEQLKDKKESFTINAVKP